MKYKLFNIIVTLIASTWRIKVIGQAPDSNSIIAFWHGSMLPVWYYFRNKNPYGVVSKSKDGQALSNLLECWNYKLIRGSSSTDGKEVLNSMIDILNNDNLLLITPDGPRGPKEECKAGMFIASQRSQKAFSFVEVQFSKKYIFEKAWDKFKFPYPFSKITLTFSEPIIIPENYSKEELNQYIQDYNKKGA
jgi:hypothetical protein